MVPRKPSEVESGWACTASATFNPEGSRFCANCGQRMPDSGGAIVPTGTSGNAAVAPTIYAQVPPQGQLVPMGTSYYQSQPPPQVHYIQAPAPVVPVQQTIIVQGQRRGCFGRIAQGVGFVVIALFVILLLILIF